MKLLDQLKTTQGQVLTNKVELYRGEDDIERIHFFVQPNAEMDDEWHYTQPISGSIQRHHPRTKSADESVLFAKSVHDQGDPSLEDLAFLWDDEGRIRYERIGSLCNRETFAILIPSTKRLVRRSNGSICITSISNSQNF